MTDTQPDKLSVTNGNGVSGNPIVDLGAVASTAINTIVGWTKAATYGSPPTLTGSLTTDGFAQQTTSKFALPLFKVN